MDIFQTFEGSNSKVDQIIVITERLDKIDRAINCIKYNDELLTKVPKIIKILGAGKDAAIAELITL